MGANRRALPGTDHNGVTMQDKNAFVREWRRKRRLTQAQAAELIGLKHRSWGGWETDGRDVPDYAIATLRYMDLYGPLDGER